MNVGSLLFGLTASFVLVGSASADVIIMGENSDGSSTNNSYSKGNVVSVDFPVACEGMGLYLENVPANTTLLWAVYEADALDGPYSMVHEVMQQVAGGSGYFDSPAMNVPLSVGKYYWLGGFWDQSVTYFYSNTAPGAPLYFSHGSGTMTYHGRNGAFATFPGPPQFSGTPSTNAPYWQSYILGGEPGVGYCFGDGLGSGCPCGNNNNGAEGGCDWGNPGYPEGGVLEATGSSSMAAANTFLVATGIENNFGIFFGANNQVNGGNGNPLNDGLRCAGGGLVRLIPPTMASGNQMTLPAPVQTLDTGAVSGVTRRYQYWFRTPTGPCAQQANLTNGYEIVWMP